jgi:hypothetical protein
MEIEMTTTLTHHRSAIDGFVLVHRSLLVSGQRLSEVLHRPSAGGDLPGIARVWSFYRAGLAEHHQGESEVIFPLVAERDPGFGELEASMAEEHAEVDALLERADLAIHAALADDAPASRLQAAGAVDALVRCLDRHLQGEELSVLPRVLAVIPSHEMEAIERGFVRQMGPRRLAMTVAALDETARREQLELPPLPLPARLALPLWRRSYSRLLAGAGIDPFGGAS